MASVIECDACHDILKDGDPYLSIERLGANGGPFVTVMGARSEFDVCSPGCLATLAADLMEAPC